ncbi:MAG: Ig-like domain-containing protein [Cyanobacteriota bacterium]
MSGQTVTPNKRLQPIDRVALGVMVVLCLLIGILLLSGDRTAPRVRSFSWQDKPISAEDTAFILTFSRPMNHDSVEANLKIEPPIPGKISWAGRRMAYTPLFPVPYGLKYQVELKGARDQLSAQKSKGTVMEPFSATFRTRDRAFAYIGIEGEEQGRLVLYNVTTQKKTVLTPTDLVVMDFKPYPDGERILFSGSDRKSSEQGLLTQQLYTVTTGLSFESAESSSSASASVGQIDLVLDSKDYQNLKFDLSPDGKTILVQRMNRRKPADFGLWLIQPDTKPRPLHNQPGGDFVIAPDSASVAVAQGQGIAILPIQPNAQPLDFLPKFGILLSFAKDGSAAAMVKFNTDYTRSLFLVTNQGTQKELLRTTGSIQSCEFARNRDMLYCLMTQLIEGEQYEEQPFLTAIDLKADADTKQSSVRPLVVLPNQRDIQMSLSPDSLALLFDQISTKPPEATDTLRSNDGQAITTGLLWLLPLAEITSSTPPTQVKPEQVLPGFHPRWLP